MPWEIAPADGFASKLRKYRKKHEAATIHYFEALQAGTKPLQITGIGIHSEGHGGVIAFDQTGGQPKLHETRLYAYPEVETETMWLITIGDKNTQQRRDIPDCRDFMKKLRRMREEQHG